MTNKNIGLFFMVAGLLVFNLWQWWPQDGVSASASNARETQRIQLSDIELSAYAADDKKINVINRDLFSADLPDNKRFVNPKKTVHKKPQNRKPKKSGNQLNRSLAKSALNQFKLVGVLFQQGERSAYLVKGDKDYSVKKGDKLEGRYLVKNVTVSTVTLLEISSKKSSTIIMH